MTDAEFQQLVSNGIDALRPDILARMDNVAIVVADEPSMEQRIDTGLGPDDVVFGLYEGVPQTERSVDDTALLPDKITIFKKPILTTYRDPKDIAECVSNTVWHEVAHHFGMSEEEVTNEEIQRGKLR